MGLSVPTKKPEEPFHLGLASSLDVPEGFITVEFSSGLAGVYKIADSFGRALGFLVRQSSWILLKMLDLDVTCIAQVELQVCMT